ncbi:hypothetical protein [Clavibacter lycopersici]|uniref:hypothetical protein n=1 Tax=Clavibacter lycopersici TaxID=2301718 RepID=UPI0011C22132|nr:hypothetical protein [Clavibacter lycopersici]
MVTQEQASGILKAGDAFSFKNISEPHAQAFSKVPEVQVAIQAARESATAAIRMAYTMNGLRKASNGRDPRGRFTVEAQDCLRSALQFSGAGLDTALKRLVEEALPLLIDVDENVLKKLQEYSEKMLSDNSGGVNPKQLVQLLLGAGSSPRDIMLGRYIYDLRSSSAQSADRVSELAGACGVTDGVLRKRIASTKNKNSLLERAFTARNQVAHELDVTKPKEAARASLESIRRYRNVDDIVKMCQEMLDVTQDIVNDVMKRIKV